MQNNMNLLKIGLLVDRIQNDKCTQNKYTQEGILQNNNISTIKI